MSTVRKLVLEVLGLGLVAALGISCSKPEDPDLPPKPEGWKLGEVTEDGRLTYEMMCQTCHGENGDGKGPSAPTLTTQPRDFTDGEYMRSRSDWRIYNTIRDGGAAVGLSSAMPSWRDAVPEPQIREVAAYVREFSNPP